MIVFWRLGIPYFYFLGVISGFASLVPSLGVFLALLPPLAGGVGMVDKSGVTIIVLTVIGLHLLSMNVLYPKIVGRRCASIHCRLRCPSVLGLDLGSNGSDSRRAYSWSHKDRL